MAFVALVPIKQLACSAVSRGPQKCTDVIVSEVDTLYCNLTKDSDQSANELGPRSGPTSCRA